MKIIVAGYPKTGTKSLNAALKTLGYNVYDYMEHFYYHNDEWEKIFEGKYCADMFKKMYENVDVVIDNPAHLFWYEIHQAFPDAKIILSIRDEKSWFESVQRQLKVLNKEASSLKQIYSRKFSPFIRKFWKISRIWMPEFTGMKVWDGPIYSQYVSNELIAKQKYRKHNSYVLQMAPKEKLLIYNVKNGWKPLCDFLDKDIPETPFPHKNIGGKDLVPDYLNHPFGLQVKKEVIRSLLLLNIAVILFSIYLYKFSFSTETAIFICFIVSLIFII